MITLQKTRYRPAAFAKHGLSVLMLVFTLTASAKSNISIVMRADTIPNGNKVYSQVKTQPQFPGGLKEFGNFLTKNIHYPAVDREAKVTGKVIVSFIVERDGSITNVKAIRGPSKTEMDEAVRVIKLSPKWNPGYQNARAVRVTYLVPITFSLSNDQVLPIAKTHAPTPVVPSATSVTALPNGEVVYSQVDKQPEFPGGLEAFGKFLGQNVHYPAAMREKMLEGKVIAQFVVEPDGSLSNIKAIRGPGYGASEEAERVLNLSPKWNPGTQKGKPVRVAYTVPINFTLKKADLKN